MVTSSSKTVLVVDDDSDTRTVIGKLLALRGHRVVPVRDGAEALRWLETGADVDLVLLDINMPEVDGFETLQRLRQLTRQIPPVVMLTALSTARAIQRCYGLGAVDYLTKPFNKEDFHAVVDGLLAQPL